MRPIFVVVVLLLGGGVSSAFAAFGDEVGGGTQRKQCTSGGLAATLACAYANNVTAGNILSLHVGTIKSTADDFASATVTGSGTGCAATTFTVVKGTAFHTDSSYNSAVAFGLASGSGACTVTFAPNTGSFWMAYSINEFVGASLQAPTEARATGSSADPAVPITTASAQSLILAAVNWRGSLTIAPDSGWTAIGETENWASCCNSAGSFRLASTAGAYSADWTLSGSAVWGGTAVAVVATETTGVGYFVLSLLSPHGVE